MGHSSPRVRYDHARRQICNTAIVSFARATEPGAWYQPQDVCEVAQAPPIGFFHINIAKARTAEGKLYLFVGIDRTSKFAVTQLVEKAGKKTAREFLQHMLADVPYRVHSILTYEGIQFTEQRRNRNTNHSQPMRFDMICEANGSGHRLTKPNHPWTNRQVGRMNHTIKNATVKRFHYKDHNQLRDHLADFMAAYNFAQTLKTLGGLTPYQYICKIWSPEPDRFIINPIQQMPGLNTYLFIGKTVSISYAQRSILY